MNAFKKISFLMILISTGCATTSREKIIRNIIVASGVGYLAGRQHDEHKNAYGLLYAGLAGSAAGIASAYFSDDENSESLLSENKRLKREIEKVYSPSLVYQGSGVMEGKVPNKYKSLINSGELKIFAMDEWIEDGDNRLIHQDKIMELTPPSLNPAIIPNVKKDE